MKSKGNLRLILGVTLLMVLLPLTLVSCAGEQGPAGPAGATGAQGAAGAAPSEAQLLNLVTQVVQGPKASAADIAHGARLYDKWSKEAGIADPTGNQALWALQTTNTRTGADTFRCKECHGWDYKGKGGAYSKGSHYTGFVGVYDAGMTKSKAQLLTILKGSTDYRHDFSKVLDAKAQADLAAFLSEGLINDVQYIDYATKKPIAADAVRGKTRYDSTCAACHGADGKQINFGSATAPEYLGTVAADNPWETLHKIRFGQPGTAAMPSATSLGWSLQDALDVLAHAQTLPQK
ncbi:MAG: c-type cytochrome [Dehalococcoidia bacterium]|nr:c-type cytochrome [Dehalococcoidia bacterium]